MTSDRGSRRSQKAAGRFRRSRPGAFLGSAPRSSAWLIVLASATLLGGSAVASAEGSASEAGLGERRVVLAPHATAAPLAAGVGVRFLAPPRLPRWRPPPVVAPRRPPVIREDPGSRRRHDFELARAQAATVARLARRVRFARDSDRRTRLLRRRQCEALNIASETANRVENERERRIREEEFRVILRAALTRKLGRLPWNAADPVQALALTVREPSERGAKAWALGEPAFEEFVSWLCERLNAQGPSHARSPSGRGLDRTGSGLPAGPVRGRANRLAGPV